MLCLKCNIMCMILYLYNLEWSILIINLELESVCDPLYINPIIRVDSYPNDGAYNSVVFLKSLLISLHNVVGQNKHDKRENCCDVIS